jgi:3D (Asp-Asp-Asp) domain-containing protein
MTHATSLAVLGTVLSITTFGSIQPPAGQDEVPLRRSSVLVEFAHAETKAEDIVLAPRQFEPTLKSREVFAQVSAYTSDAAETDDTPNITANGEHVGPGTIACPSRLPFGTLVVIEGKRYHCNDRMAARYRNKEVYDIWVPTKSQARNWGRRELTITVYGTDTQKVVRNDSTGNSGANQEGVRLESGDSILRPGTEVLHTNQNEDRGGENPE